LQVELLEARNLLATPANVLVNNTAADTTSQDTQSETAIVLGSGSTVVAAFNDSESNVGGANHFTGFSVSGNGGTSFTDAGTLPASSNGDVGDPVLARDNVKGNIYLSTLSFSGSNRLQLFTSTNNGASFGAPINAAPGLASSDFVDKPWLTVDNASGLGQGVVYATYTDFGLRSTTIRFQRALPGGATFAPSGGTQIASGVVQGSNVNVGTDHSVYVFWLDQTSGSKIKVVKSTNHGGTFGTATTVATLKSNGSNGDLGLNGGFRSNTFPQSAVNAANGNIYVVYDDVGQAAGDKADVFFTQSTDGGTTWSTPLKLNDDTTTNDQWFPAIAVTPDGSHVFVTWYDRRLDPANSLIDRFGVIGTVSGSTVSFGANFRITDTSFPVVVNQDPSIATGYMGDYDTATADNSFFYTTWGDNRLADAAHANNPDVRFAKISINGPSGAAAFSPGASAGALGGAGVSPVPADAAALVAPPAAAGAGGSAGTSGGPAAPAGAVAGATGAPSGAALGASAVDLAFIAPDRGAAGSSLDGLSDPLSQDWV
jgi:hypothetical protein